MNAREPEPGLVPVGPSPAGSDAYKPSEIIRLVEASGVAKTQLTTTQVMALAILAGAFIGFGAAFYTGVMTGVDPGFGPNRVLGGFAFCLGLILVVVGGAELFTGNALIVMAWVDRQISTRALLRNWGLVLVGNVIGAAILAVAVDASGLLSGATAATAVKIAEAKMALPFTEAFVRGALCNALVCLAVWLSVAARTATGKILAILWPITAFVALGFEHSVANFYFLAAGFLAGAQGGLLDILGNLVPVTLGNIVGGTGGVALAYWAAYRRRAPAE
ncbi:formate/nitrite transporter family protein [Microbaculum marinum]|uniref:Formate/nitrite transporter family protein n=1 Tax=Microbaculum marinum TaxID=1764581 RepID=A0AAW9RSU1_9HYPH